MLICSNNLLSELSNVGDVEIQYSFGVKCYFEREYGKAFPCFYRAALNGDVTAMWYVALMYSYGLGVNESLDKSILWFEKAIDDQKLLSGNGKLLNSVKMNEGDKVNYVNWLALHYQTFCE